MTVEAYVCLCHIFMSYSRFFVCLVIDCCDLETLKKLSMYVFQNTISILFFYKIFLPICICPGIDCGDPGTPSNGSRTGDVFTFGGTVRYRCNHGYRLSGSSNRTCEASGRWSGNKTDCKGRTMQFISDLAFLNCFPTE